MTLATLTDKSLSGCGAGNSSIVPFAMVPPASVSGYIFSHPGSTYFNVGKIGSDQLKDYALRKNMTIDEAARWLAPNL